MSVSEQLISAIEKKDNGKVFELFDFCVRFGLLCEINKALHAACEKHNDEALDKLLAKTGIDVNVKTGCGASWTPLHMASRMNNAYAVSRLVATPNVDVNARDANGWSPLAYACCRNHHQVVKHLLTSPDIQVNQAERHGITPIMRSAGVCHMETLKMMLEDPRVDLDAKDQDGDGLEKWVGLGGGNYQKQEKEKCLEMINSEKMQRKNGQIQKQEKEKCLEMINSEKMQRKNGQMEQQTSEDGSIGRRIEMVDRLNKEIRDEEEKLKKNVGISKQKREDLKEQQASEKEKLAKELAAKHKKEESHLETIIKTEAKSNERCIGLLKGQRDELVRDLQKIRIDPAQDVSEDRDKLEDALNKQEAAKRALECPVCFQFMRPPTRIWMCEFTHLICEACKDALEASDLLVGGKCPTCTTRPVNQRAFVAEQFAKISFN